MSGRCRFLSVHDVTLVENNSNVRAHLKTNFHRYLAITNGSKNIMYNNPNFSTFDIMQMITDNIHRQGSITQLYTLEQEGFTAIALSSLFARICWEYPNMSSDRRKKMGL